MIRRLLPVLLLAPVAAWGQVITQPIGLAPITPGYVTNNWYAPYGYNITASTPTAPGTGTVVCTPASVLAPVTINSLGGRITTLSAGGNVQFALYASGSWGRPSTLLASTASITTAATGVVNAAVTAVSIPAGGYWWCSNADNAVVVLVAQAANNNGPNSQLLGSATQGQAGHGASTTSQGISVAQTFNTWPTFTSGTAWTDIGSAIAPYIEFKVQSSP